MAHPAPTQGDADILLRSDKDGIATLTLNRPRARNALSLALMSAAIDELETIAGDASVKAVVIAGNGPAFCAGHDLKEVRANPGRAFYENTFAQCSRMMQAVVRLPQPVIARVHGIATAAGCQLVASCDLAIAADTARFATPGVNIGLFCSTPMVALSRNISRKQAMEMLLTGEIIDASTAREFGLVNRVVPADYLAQVTAKYAETIASKSPLTLKYGKEAFYAQAEMSLADAYRHCAQVMVENMLARDAEEGIGAFIEKRTPEWTGE
jgi:enoyl-CoA hydratase/carnithine racemase